MRSQKQNNRSPRPFKNKGNDRGWSGGNRNDTPPPFSKFALKAKKADGTTSSEVPPATPANPTDKPTAADSAAGD